jgi:2-methylcitrate dehydratase PrpD
LGEWHPASVRSIVVDTYQTAIDVTGNFAPRSAYQAKFSLPYVVCHALLYGSVRLNAFAEQRLHDERTRALMSRVRLNSDPALSAGFPSKRAARVTMTTEDGRTFQHFSPFRKGDPEAPLTDAELNDKFDELVAPVIGSEPAARLRSQLWQLDKIDLSELRLVPQ